ncbi:MAG: DUF3754 domain-containing protein [Isosphaeraceae bacterium]|nr:DUF3754 domain-containing protein [Isosphaeraceae bacterium]
MPTKPPIPTRPDGETTGSASTISDVPTVVQKAIGPGSLFQLPSCGNRENALPIRQGDLNRLLLAEPGVGPDEREHLIALGRLLGAWFHSEFYDELHELKELYAPLDPDNDYVTLNDHTRPLTDQSDEEFLVPFERALKRANYRTLDLEIIKAAVAAPNELGLNFVPDFTLFEHLRVYVRGYTRITRDCRTIKNKFRKQTVHLDAYQRLVIALKFKAGLKLGPLVTPDFLYLRMFKDVPHVDMEMHLPEQGTKPRMRKIDLAQIVSPFMVSIPTLLFKIITATIFSPILAGTLVVAPISAGVNSFFGFQRAKQRHLATMIHRLYYQTLANNASVLTRLIDSAEDEEYKEAVLAYYFLWRDARNALAPPHTVASLDDRIESYLKDKTGVEIDFEVTDALRKLFRLGLASRDPRGGLHAISLEEALRKLDQLWDDRFRYA